MDGTGGNDIGSEQCLLVHNFPRTFSERDKRQLLQLFDPISVEILVPYRAVYATFPSREHARDVLGVLHQQMVDGRRLFVEYADGSARDMTSILKRSGATGDQPDRQHCEPTTVEEAYVNVLRKLYATADNLDFNQPPPPHLRYNYPLVNRDIVDSISIALETSRPFYVQVLHLMNRMNLEPPFVHGDKKLKYESTAVATSKSAFTQTDEIVWHQFIRNKRKRVASDESELATTSSEGEEKAEKPLPRRERPESVQSVEKQRRMLKMQRIQMEARGEKRSKAETSARIDSAFDSPHPLQRTIKIIAPKELPPTTADTTAIDVISTDSSKRRVEQACATPTILSDAEIQENRIPEDQLRTHPMFQNYEPGAVTNRLYIKNIAKDVTEDDLRAIYYRYLEKNCNGEGNVRSIEIRLMQTGRMKGQAFITFSGPYLESDDDMGDAQKYRIIAKALTDTNGLIVRSKPLVVTYAKKK